MMPNVVRGDRMGGLLTYLVGEGRHNEHTEQHLVAGDGALMAWHGDAELDHAAALAIARHLDRPRTAFDVEVPGGHVWHCSLSLRPGTQLSDETWGAIATRFVSKMGFDDQDGTRAACRWVAVRHGLSQGGNDHVHLVVNLVREDGTKASTFHDWPRAQRAARDLEVDFHLERLESAQSQLTTRGYKPAEVEAQARSRARATWEKTHHGQAWTDLPAAQRETLIAGERAADTPRVTLARTVRACATASEDEAEFVRRLRRAGVLPRPRYASGRMDVVTGYSVAARPSAGERPIWYGGGRLGEDLTLPRLREAWPDTPDSASAAVAEWNAAHRHRRPANPGRETREITAADWARCDTELRHLRQQLEAVPVDDRDAWARVARESAGVFAAWSHRVEPTPGPLAVAADALGRSAQLKRWSTTPKRVGRLSSSGTALLLMSATKGGKGIAAEAALLRQLVKLSVAVYQAHQARGEAERARELARVIDRELKQVHDRLPKPVTVGASIAPSSPEQDALRAATTGRPGTPGSPVPNRLEPRRRTVQHGHPPGGLER